MSRYTTSDQLFSTSSNYLVKRKNHENNNYTKKGTKEPFKSKKVASKKKLESQKVPMVQSFGNV